MPYFDQVNASSEYYELVETAAQVRRHIIYQYARQLTVDENIFQIKFGYIPEPFGDIDEFIAKIEATIPTNLSPDTIGVAYPQRQYIS